MLNRKNLLTILPILVFSLFAGVHIVFAQSADLISQWDGDAVLGTTVRDTNGGNNGTIFGRTPIAPGKVGNAFNSSWINIGNPANLNFGTADPFSLEIWFNWDARRSADTNDIIRKSNYPVEGPGAGYWLRINVPDISGTKGNLEFFVGETVGIPNQPRGNVTTPISPRVWYHVVATRDSSGTMKLYVDGELKGTAEAPNANTASGAVFTIGAWADRFGVTESFTGLIDEVSVYSRALGSSEVQALYDWVEGDSELYPIIEPYIKSGETPGQCTTVRECRAYCDLEENFDECFDFAVKAGLIEIEDPYLLALQNGEAPGGCIGEDACAEYCGEASHIKECVVFFAKFDVFPPDVLQMLYDLIATCEQEPDFVACIKSAAVGAEEPADLLGTGIKVGVGASQAVQKVQDAMQKGESPGGCKDEVSCRNYCENIDNIKECSDFADEFDLVTPDELEEMRKIAMVKQAGVNFPGNCKTKESCLKYCDNSANAVECMEFAQKAGFIPKEDAESVGKILPYLKSGGKLPGGCTTKKSCDAYCESDTHTNECVDFAVGAGFMNKEEADIVKKVGGKGPGNCKSKEACENYCKDETHIDECVDFAVKAGFISQADAADAKKYRITSGPGGCKGKAECEAFCVLPENQDTCFKFAKDHGMISEEDLKNIEQYRNQGPPDFSQVNPEWLACMEKEMGSAIFGRFKAGKSDRSDVSAIQAAQKTCQSEMGPNTKECLAKPTCEEFVACLNPSGSRTSQQEGLEQESPSELKERMDSCQDELKETKMKEVQEKFDACFTLSCSEYEACMKSIEQSGDQQDGQQQAQETPDPKIKAKAEACQKEKINACLAKSCDEFQSCINSLGGGGGGGGTPDPAVQAKFQSCQSPPPSGDSGGQQQQSGDQSGIPQGYSSWQEFCTANYSDSRCAR